MGGNAIQAEDNSAAAQQEAVRKTMKTVASMIESGNQVAITHGNGPQVGNLLLQQHKGASENNPAMPLDTISAMTQGSIGYWMQKALDDQFKFDNYPSQAVALVTQTIVESNDPAFEHPTKPIGPFYTFNEMPIVRFENTDDKDDNIEKKIIEEIQQIIYMLLRIYLNG